MNPQPLHPARESKGFSPGILACALGCLLTTPLAAQLAPPAEPVNLAGVEQLPPRGFGVLMTPEQIELESYRQFLDLHLKLGNDDEAVDYAHRILDRVAKDPDATAALLGIALKRKEAEPALDYAVQYRIVRPGTEADALWASALRLNGRYNEAMVTMEALHDASPKGRHFPYLLELCYAYVDTRQVEKARTCFEKVRDDQRYSPKQRAAAVKELANLDRDARIKEAYLALEQRNLKKARAIAEEVMKLGPKPHSDAMALMAVVEADELGKVEEAAETFEWLKEKHEGPGRYPYHGAYAVQLLDLGRYEEAEFAANQASLSDTGLLTEDERYDQLEAIRSVRTYSRSTVSLDGIFVDSTEGRGYRADGKLSVPFNGKRTRAGVEYRYSEIDLDDTIPSANEDEYHHVLATLSHQFARGLTATVAGGAAGNNFAYKVAVKMNRPSKDSWVEVKFEGGQRPDDTLILEAHEAKEYRLALAADFEAPVNRRLRFRGEAHARKIDLDSAGIGELGEGWGVRAEVEYLLYKHRRATMALAYVGAFENFDFSGAAKRSRGMLPFDATELVEDDFFSQGLVLRGRYSIQNGLNILGSVGALYRFDDDEMVYHFGAGLEWWYDDFSRLSAEGAYYTSGKAGNAGSGYFEGRLGIDSTF